MQTVGIIGTGEIGWRMGRLLMAAGHPVFGFDTRLAALHRARESGFSIAPSVSDICRRCDVIITCVTDGDALRDVVEGDGRLLRSLQPGKTLIDTTSAEPWITHELASTLKEAGIHFLDAPVSGGVPAAESGTMNFMVGGDRTVLERWRPLLQRLGPVITHVGEAGAGHTIKAINMLALAASMLATAEVLAIGRRAGLRLEELVERLQAGIGASYSTRVHFPRFVVPGNFQSGFSFDLMLKDLSIAVGLADRSSIPLFVGRTAWEFYRVASKTGFAGKDNTRIVEPVLGSDRRSIKPAEATELPGQLEKLAAMSNTVIAAEMVCLGAGAGLPVATVIDVLSAGSGDSHALSKELPGYLDGNSDDTVGSIAEAIGDGAAALHTGFREHVPVLLTGQVMAVHAAASGRYGGSASRLRLLDLIAKWTGQHRVVSREVEA